ncbi:MAG: endonuclease [Bacteroidota bacterium]
MNKSLRKGSGFLTLPVTSIRTITNLCHFLSGFFSYICRVKVFHAVAFLFLSIKVCAGTITCSISSIPGFGNVYPFHSSTSLRYTVSGTALTSNLVISADSNYEVSLSYLQGYRQSISITPASGSVAATTIYVRFSPTATGTFSRTISHSSTGSPTVNVSVSGTCIAWAIPSTYYSTVTTQRGASLKTVLYNRISTGTTTLSYTPGVWNAFATTDVQPNGKVWDIYSTLLQSASPYEYTMSTDQCGTYSVEGDCYNREHTMPQSWFVSANPMTSDVHHLMASDGKVNGERGNFPYGNVTTVAYTSLYGGKRGTGTTNSGYTGTVFEPIDEYKGDVARAQLYMATRYENLIASWQGNGNADEVLAGNSFPAYDSWYINLLISWNNLDPVSDKEIKRNNAIYSLQGNRNPYIDSPQLVQRIWGGSLPSEPTANASNILFTNNGNTSVTLNWTSGNGQRRLVVIRASAPVNVLPVDTVRYSANANLASAQHLGSGNYVVYNGTGSRVRISGLTQGVTYHVAVIEYNGWYTTSNYRTSSYLTSSTTTLPVEWLSFEAHEASPGVLLKWSTASELNNAYFTVERSIEGNTFTAIGTVNGKGTTLLRTHYSFTDYNAKATQKNTTYYYRIKQTDADGATSYSHTETITLYAHGDESVQVIPNPVADRASFIFADEQFANGTYIIQNLQGQTVVYDTEIILHEKNKLVMDCSFLPAGMYIIAFRKNNRYTHLKFIKHEPQ